MIGIAPLAGAAGRALSARRAQAFRRALQDPGTAQEGVLRRITGALAATDYGRTHGLTPDADYAAFADRLPVAAYDDLAPFVSRIARGERDVLWPGRPRFWRSTSGSGGPAKQVPVHAALRGAFTDMVRIWAHDLLSRHYRPVTGRLFMSLSPPGEDDLLGDADYVGGPLGALLRRFLVAPSPLGRLSDPLSFRRALAACLLAETDLELVSIWSPSYLLAVLETIERERDRLLHAFDAGALPVESEVLTLPPLTATRRRMLLGDPIDWQGLWPRLQLISCWTDAAAAGPADMLRRRFPDVLVQGKGLVATETPVTLPLLGAPGPVPLVDTVFLEFQAADGTIARLSEVEEGETYTLVVSSPGGFVRYRLGDLVRIVGRYGRTPCLAFVGRADAVADLVGEKLHEAFVGGVLSAVMGPGFAMLVPAGWDCPPAGYLLVVERPEPGLAEAVERALCSGFHYRRARALGQLAPVRVLPVAAARRRVTAFFEAAGLRWGDIKDRALITDLETAGRLVGELTAASRAPAPPEEA